MRHLPIVGRYFIAVAGEFLVCPQGRPLGSAQPMKGKEERKRKEKEGEEMARED